jgi:hypothetical protein
MTLYGQSKAVADFVAKLLKCEDGFDPCEAIGFLDKHGNLVAGFVYHAYQPDCGVIEISAASTCRDWATRDRLKAIFDYPFGIGCRMVLTRTGEHNRRVRRIWRSLGGQEYVIPALRSPTEAEIIMTLTAGQWQDSKFGV